MQAFQLNLKSLFTNHLPNAEYLSNGFKNGIVEGMQVAASSRCSRWLPWAYFSGLLSVGLLPRSRHGELEKDRAMRYRGSGSGKQFKASTLQRHDGLPCWTTCSQVATYDSYCTGWDTLPNGGHKHHICLVTFWCPQKFRTPWACRHAGQFLE